MIIELIGLPRAGKTTLINKYFSKEYTIHKEAFNIIPYLKNQHNKYNLWYAKHIIYELKKAAKDKKNHVFDRGVFDRYAFAKTLYQDKKLTKTEFNLQKKLLKNMFKNVDLIIYCQVSVEDSLNRDTPSSFITGNKNFLQKLKTNYDNLSQKFDFIKIPTNHSVEKSAKALEKILNE